jgi:hypothetical protein
MEAKPKIFEMKSLAKAGATLTSLDGRIGHDPNHYTAWPGDPEELLGARLEVELESFVIS